MLAVSVYIVNNEKKVSFLFSCHLMSEMNMFGTHRMLEESTWALDPHPSAPAASIQALGYDFPWHLVALFCRVHSLPRSLTLLHELARNNDWVMLLGHECGAAPIPRKQTFSDDYVIVMGDPNGSKALMTCP